MTSEILLILIATLLIIECLWMTVLTKRAFKQASKERATNKKSFLVRAAIIETLLIYPDF